MAFQRQFHSERAEVPLLDNRDRCGRRHLPLAHEKLDPGDAYENMLRPGGGKNTRERGKRFTSWFKSRPGIQAPTALRLNDLMIIGSISLSGSYGGNAPLRAQKSRRHPNDTGGSHVCNR